MITFEDACKLIEKQKLSCVRVFDFSGNNLLAIEETRNAAQTVEELRSWEPMLCGYTKITIKAATDEQKKANYKGAYTWIIGFTKGAAATTPAMPGAFSQMSALKEFFQMFQMMQSMSGLGGSSELATKVKELELKHEYEKKMRELEDKHKDPVDKYGHFAPMLLSMMGKKDEEIEKMMKWTMMGKNFQNANPATISGPPTTTTLTFSDVQRMTPEDKNKKIEDLIEAILKKVNWQDFTKLLAKFDEKPELVVTAINALPMLNLGDPLPNENYNGKQQELETIQAHIDSLSEKISAEHFIMILEAVDKRPDMIKKALPLLANF